MSNIEKMHYGLDPVFGLSIDIAGIRITLHPKQVDCNDCKFKMIEHGILIKCKNCSQLMENNRNHKCEYK